MFRFGDLFGSRKALMIAFISAFASYFLLGISNTLFVLFLSRLPSVFMHAMQGNLLIKLLAIQTYSLQSFKQINDIKLKLYLI